MKLTETEKSLFETEQATMEDICAGVSGGNTLPEWCEAHGARFGVVGAWINASPDRLSPYAKATLMMAEWFEQTIYKELRGIATLDIRGLLNEDGEIKPVSEWPDSTARAVGGVEIDDITDKNGASVGTKRKVKLLDKIKSIELLMKNHRMLSERVEHTGKISLETLVAESNEPEKK